MTKLLNFRIQPCLLAAIQVLAQEAGVSTSTFVRQAVVEKILQGGRAQPRRREAA